jgi:general secretion pathway protein G
VREERKPKNRKARRQSVTLIEMIIVMILIATITGALALNYQKSLDRGRLFATQQRVERLRAILTLYFSMHPDEAGTNTDYITIINDSGLGPPKPEQLLKDDWGQDFQIVIDRNNGDPKISIESPATKRLKIS